MDFTESCAAVFAQLGDHNKMVLATSSNNHTTARMMTCILLDHKIYMQTDTAFEKYQQMLENPQVALCSDNLQIEGLASFRGHPLAAENEAFLRLFRQYYPTTFENYSRIESEVLVEILPTKITLWCYEAAFPYRDRLDFVQQTAHREAYPALAR